jgi:hypothetical protein
MCKHSATRMHDTPATTVEARHWFIEQLMCGLLFAGFENAHSQQECIDLIEQYAALGCDDGLTQDMMRMVCGLKSGNRTHDAAPGVAAAAALAPPESQSAEYEAPQIDPYDALVQFLADKCIDDNEDALTFSAFNYMYKLLQGTPNADRATL